MTRTLSEDEVKRLVEVAKESRDFAMAFKSVTRVGASVLAEGGEVFGGCNVDGVASGQGTCAERSAVNHAVAHGKYRFSGLCTYGDDLCWPCGDCLQYALMFCQVTGGDIQVVVAAENRPPRFSSVKELLPHGFMTKQFGDRLKEYFLN